ncbi:hypothetical protein [Paenibacillus sp. R14(2021)]|uniref:hypothetical protein n=1 Tax=Paenibacillus sp. R14(2021) TaxID=2859228 RepID=UPI001C6156DD|nr:hypothetical protein [Paenibacillus sp. R14(2021)]
MNKMLGFKRIAMSTLLLSSVAVPAYAANAATEPAAAKIVTARQAEELPPLPALSAAPMAAVKLPDPLALAGKYAPDTVNDWMQTLDKLKQLVPANVTITKTADGKTVKIAAAGVLPGPFKIVDGKAVPAEQAAGGKPVLFWSAKPLNAEEVKPGEAVKLETKGTPVSISGTTVTTLSGTSGPLADTVFIAGEAKPVDVNIAAPAGTPEDGSMMVTAFSNPGDTGPILTVAPGGDKFITSIVALNEAVKAEDADAIKAALADLLKVYKAQIAELEKK